MRTTVEPGEIDAELDRLEAKMHATDAELSELVRNPRADRDFVARAMAANREIQKRFRELDAKIRLPSQAP